MKGRILAYSASVGAGLIRCTEGRDHIFYLKDWKTESEPQAEMAVQFKGGYGEAQEVKAAD